MVEEHHIKIPSGDNFTLTLENYYQFYQSDWEGNSGNIRTLNSIYLTLRNYNVAYYVRKKDGQIRIYYDVGVIEVFVQRVGVSDVRVSLDYIIL